jgi:hypothetical protein
MIKLRNAKRTTAKNNEQAQLDLESLSDQELIPALLEQVVGGAALTCFKQQLAVRDVGGIALTCFKQEVLVRGFADNLDVGGALGNLADIAALRR